MTPLSFTRPAPLCAGYLLGLLAVPGCGPSLIYNFDRADMEEELAKVPSVYVFAAERGDDPPQKGMMTVTLELKDPVELKNLSRSGTKEPFGAGESSGDFKAWVSVQWQPDAEGAATVYEKKSYPGSMYIRGADLDNILVVLDHSSGTRMELRGFPAEELVVCTVVHQEDLYHTDACDESSRESRSLLR